jgi:hypothetical protein
MTTDQIISVASSVGTFLAALGTFMTVREMSKQRRASYRPELAFSTVAFEAQPEEVDEKLPIFWRRKGGRADEPPQEDRLLLPLTNIGLAAAKDVSLRWSFPIKEVVQQVNGLAQRSLTPAYFQVENDSLEMKSDITGIGSKSFFWTKQMDAHWDYVAPAAIEREPTLVGVPPAYILVVSALLHFGFRSPEKGALAVMPPLSVDLKFADLAGDKHQASFEYDCRFFGTSTPPFCGNGRLKPKRVS